MNNKEAFAGGGLADWLRVLSERHPTTVDLGLERVEEVRAALNLTLPMPTVIVGGTNGKGSVCAMLCAMCRAGGIKTVRYTSPHLLNFNERIVIDGELANDDSIVSAFARVEATRANCDVSLTYFEFTTLAAALMFSESGADVAVLEVGLGGRLDAVNIFPPAVAAVTNVAIDHQEFLGDSIESIAFEKAGIFRPQIQSLIGDSSATTLLEEADKIGATVSLAERDFSATPMESGWNYRGVKQLFSLPYPAMRGRHQLANAALAIAILERLPSNLWPGAGAVREGLHAAVAPGRAQVLPGSPARVLDVAHNPAAAAVLERMLFDMGYYPRTSAVLGMTARKDAAGFVRALQKRVDVWHVVCPPGGDLDANDLAKEVNAAGGKTEVYDSMAEAAQAAHACCGNNGRMLITGSFLTVAGYMQHINELKDATHQ